MFLHITTQIEGRKNDDLLGVVGGRGFPSFFMLDAEGSVIGQHSGPRSAAGFAKTASAAAEFVAMRKKAAGGDAAAAFDVALAKAKMRQLDVAGLKAARAKAGDLSPERETAYKGVLAGLQMEEIQRTAVGKAFLQMHNEGLIPTDQQQRGMFYYNIWQYASYKKDVPLMETALNHLEQAWGENPRYARFVKQFKAQLAKMKADAK